MAKNPFKKQSIVDTAINVGIGGAANVAIDYVVTEFIDTDAANPIDENLINGVKFGLGVIGGTMVSNKMVRAALDGVAVVGVSNLIAGLMKDTDDGKSSGVPYGTVGRIQMGMPKYIKAVNSGKAKAVTGAGKFVS